MKAIKKYTGGIHFLIQAAVSEDGVLFVRHQSKNRYGYVWSKWARKGEIDINNIPRTITCGFSTLYAPSTYNDFSVRLPK